MERSTRERRTLATLRSRCSPVLDTAATTVERCSILPGLTLPGQSDASTAFPPDLPGDTCMGLFARKSIAVLQDEAGQTGADTLKRVLSASNLTLLGIGAIIGAGIFVLTGTAAALHAGPAVVFS